MGDLPPKKRLSGLTDEELKAKKQKLFAEGRLNTKIKPKPTNDTEVIHKIQIINTSLR